MAKKKPVALWACDAAPEWRAGQITLAAFADDKRRFAVRLTPQQAIALARKLDSLGAQMLARGIQPFEPGIDQRAEQEWPFVS